MKRETILDHYFEEMVVEKVKSKKEDWAKIRDKLSLWE
jgi:hypothetical protein